MARREASNALLRFYREIGYKRYTAWLVHPQADYQRVVYVGYVCGTSVVLCNFLEEPEESESCRHCPTVTLVSLHDISFAFNFDFVYPKSGVQTKVYRQGCG